MEVSQRTYKKVGVALIGPLTDSAKAAIDQAFQQDDTLFSPNRKKDLFERLRQCHDFSSSAQEANSAILELTLE